MNTSFPRSSQEHSSEVTIPPSTEHGTLYSEFSSASLVTPSQSPSLPQTQPRSVGDSPRSVLAQVSFPLYGILCILTKNTIHVRCPADRFIMNPGLSYCRQTLSYLSHNGRPPSFDIPPVSSVQSFSRVRLFVSP